METEKKMGVDEEAVENGGKWRGERRKRLMERQADVEPNEDGCQSLA